MPRFDDYLLWKSELTDGLGARLCSALGPERAYLVTADKLPAVEKGYGHTRYAVVGCGPEMRLSALADFTVAGKRPFFLLSEGQELAQERLLPGPDHLFTGPFPELGLRALVSSSAVISFSLTPAVVAMGNRIPAVVISQDPKTLWLAEKMAIPCLKKAAPQKMRRALADLFENYSWDVPFLQAALFKEKFAPAAHPRLDFATYTGAAPRALTVALISDCQYLPQLLGIMANLSEVSLCPVHFEILALDKATEEFVLELNQYRNVTLTSFADLWPGVPVEGWSPCDKALRSKARFLLRLVRKLQKPLFYFDTDVHFKRCPSSLLTEFENQSLLLFPNWNDSPVETRQFGIFNAGMIGVRPGCERFLEVWAQFCHKHYDGQKHGEGYFVDQGFLDLVPLYVDDFTVYRRGDENAARWNQSTQEGHAPLRSFHASQPDAKGFYAEKIIWDQAHWIFRRDEETPVVPQRWRHLLIPVWREHWLALSRWNRLHQTAERWGLRWLSSEGAAKFLTYGLGRHALSCVAWVRRNLLAEHRSVPRAKTETWIAEQQLAIRETANVQRTFLPSILPFEISELSYQETIPLSPRNVEIH